MELRANISHKQSFNDVLDDIMAIATPRVLSPPAARVLCKNEALLSTISPITSKSLHPGIERRCARITIIHAQTIPLPVM